MIWFHSFVAIHSLFFPLHKLYYIQNIQKKFHFLKVPFFVLPHLVILKLPATFCCAAQISYARVKWFINVFKLYFEMILLCVFGFFLARFCLRYRLSWITGLSHCLTMMCIVCFIVIPNESALEIVHEFVPKLDMLYDNICLLEER